MSPVAPSDSTPPATSLPRGRVPLRRAGCLIFASFSVMFIAGSLNSIVQSGIAEARQNDEIQAAHGIGVALLQYAHDHDGHYPQGKSSTEIFQQLLDQKYIDDPTVFYISMRGKNRAQGKVLKPENVCWDVTADVGPNDPDSLPIVYLTGYKARYSSERGMTGFSPANFVAVMTKEGMAYLLSSAHDGTIHLFVAKDYDPRTHPYLQLTPEGPASP